MWFFRFGTRQVAQKTSSNIFKKNKENCAMLDRSIPKRDALVHSIPISEVKGMKSDLLRALKASPSKKTLNLVWRLKFNNF
jgi:hypothetical protein